MQTTSVPWLASSLHNRALRIAELRRWLVL
jgi:hypothetical protein